jgi:hypothetical protein
MFKKVLGPLLLILMILNISIPLKVIEMAHFDVTESVNISDFDDFDKDPSDDETDEGTLEVELFFISSILDLPIFFATLNNFGILSEFISSYIQKLIVPPSI